MRLTELDLQLQEARNAVIALEGPNATLDTRRGHNLDAVRSEAEYQAVLLALQTEDNIRLRAERTAAKIPTFVADVRERQSLLYDNRNHIVRDPIDFYLKSSTDREWSEGEIDVFKKRFAAHPKHFGRIAHGIPDRSTRDCIRFYYQKKKSLCFKSLIDRRKRKNGIRKTTYLQGRVRDDTLSQTHHLLFKNDHLLLWDTQKAKTDTLSAENVEIESSAVLNMAVDVHNENTNALKTNHSHLLISELKESSSSTLLSICVRLFL